MLAIFCLNTQGLLINVSQYSDIITKCFKSNPRLLLNGLFQKKFDASMYSLVSAITDFR